MLDVSAVLANDYGKAEVCHKSQLYPSFSNMFPSRGLLRQIFALHVRSPRMRNLHWSVYNNNLVLSRQDNIQSSERNFRVMRNLVYVRAPTANVARPKPRRTVKISPIRMECGTMTSAGMITRKDE